MGERRRHHQRKRKRVMGGSGVVRVEYEDGVVHRNFSSSCWYGSNRIYKTLCGAVSIINILHTIKALPIMIVMGNQLIPH